MHWQTAGNLKRKEKTKSSLFPWAPLAVTGTGQADDIGFFISGWIKSSKHHWLRAEANPTVGSSPEGVPMPGPLGFGVIFWENSSGMRGRCVWAGKGFGMEPWHTQTLSVGTIHPRELSAPHSSPGCRIQLHSHLITASDDTGGY